MQGVPGDNVASDEPVEIRVALPSDAEGLADCFRVVYGDSYDHSWVYDPDQIRARWSARETMSVVGVDSSGDIVAHLACNFDRPDARVGESGQAVVDPRWRGHHIFESLKVHLADRSREDGLYGLYSEATAVHPYSQKGSLALGAHETGFMVGYIPTGVDYKAITDGAAAHRETVALMYLRTNDEPQRVAHVPEAFADIVGRVYANGGYRRAIGEGEGSSAVEDTVVHIKQNDDLNSVQLHCKEVGADVHGVIEGHLAELRADGVDCIYLDLPVADPDVAVHGADLDGLGFVYACILPEVRDDGDVLRLQLLNGVDPHIEEIATASDFGAALLTEIAGELGVR